MDNLSRRLFAGLVSLALAGLFFATALPSRAQDEVEEPSLDQQLRVTYLLYSGLPNPTLTITDPSQVADIQWRISYAESTGTPIGGEGPDPVLGYNGVMIEDLATADMDGSTFYVIKNDVLRVDGGNPDDPSTRWTTISSDAAAVESLLITMGIQNGVIDPATLAEMSGPLP